MMKVLETVNNIVWGIPALVLILGIGLYLSIRTGFAQIRFFPRALGRFLARLRRRDTSQGVSPFQALCTALAATVGTGNLAGVAGAMAIGGPGAIFWMWVCGILGMMTKYAEATLAVRYQVCHPDGTCSGGPMHMITRGLGPRWRPLALCYCFFGVIASFGVGNCTQINAVLTGIREVSRTLGYEGGRGFDLCLGILFGILVVAMLLGGARRIGEAAEKLVPFAAGLYILLAAGVLVVRGNQIPRAVMSILSGAFSPRAVTGGTIGSVFLVLRVGISRGVFTNEAGMGTASIAHGSTRVRHPAEQGLMGIMEVFLDTLVICTMTALVILVSGTPIPYGIDEGLALTNRAFASVYGGWISVVITLETCCFAFATILGWGLYGARCAEFLFGKNVWKAFALVQGIAVVFGAVWDTGTVWLLADTVNGLMAIPNLVALVMLSPELVRLTASYRLIHQPRTLGQQLGSGKDEDDVAKLPVPPSSAF